MFSKVFCTYLWKFWDRQNIFRTICGQKFFFPSVSKYVCCALYVPSSLQIYSVYNNRISYWNWFYLITTTQYCRTYYSSISKREIYWVTILLQNFLKIKRFSLCVHNVKSLLTVSILLLCVGSCEQMEKYCSMARVGSRFSIIFFFFGSINLIKLVNTNHRYGKVWSKKDLYMGGGGLWITL